MPIQTSDLLTHGQAAEPKPVKPRKKKAEVETSAVCGHICRHTTPELVCVLEAGHEGHHTDRTSHWRDEAGYASH